MEFEKTDCVEYCYVIYWEDDLLKKICIDGQPLDQKFLDAELVSVARVISRFEDQQQLPVAIRGCSPLLLRVLSECRCDSRQFIVTRQAHQDVFGMVELVTLVEYIVC